jgi:hypothetical protein
MRPQPRLFHAGEHAVRNSDDGEHHRLKWLRPERRVNGPCCGWGRPARVVEKDVYAAELAFNLRDIRVDDG